MRCAARVTAYTRRSAAQGSFRSLRSLMTDSLAAISSESNATVPPTTALDPRATETGSDRPCWKG
jgi:hypothetical protein